MEAAAAMDFHALSRRELQALCKRNGVRANMTNAAMAEALQGLTSVDGIDEIGTTLCLPTPGRPVMKSAAKMPELAGEEQQLGSPLPRGRRVSVKSPEAIRMEVEEGEDEMKRGLVKEIVKTPGVALRSTSRRTRATPAPLPTPAPASNTRATVRTAARKTAEVAPTPATLRRSQRTASRKAEGPVESEELSAAKVTTTPARSKMTMAFDHVAEVAAPAPKEEEKVQQDEPKADVSDVKCEDPEEKEVHQEEPKVVASDVKCDDSEEEEVTKILERDNKEEELEEGEEVDSSDAITRSAVVYDKSCNDPKVEEVVIVMEKQSTKSQEGILEEKEPTSVEKAPLTVMEDSPILGLLSKAETAVPIIEEEQDASVEDCEDLAESSPAREMTDEIIPVEDKEVIINEEAVKEDGFAVTGETDPTPSDVHPATVGEDTIEEDGKKGAADEMPQAGETSEEDEEDCLIESTDGAADEVLQAELTDDETSEEGEDDLTEVKEGAAAKMLQGELTDSEISEEDDLDEDEEWTSDDDENIEETGSTDDSDEDTDETNEESYTADAVQMGTVIAEEANEDASTEDDDFSGDLPSEFDNITISDAETESDIAPPVLEENQAAVASATKTAKSLDASAMNAEHEVPEEADATEKAMKEVNNIVKSLDEFTVKLGEAKETQDYSSMSLRQLKTTYKQRLVASKAEGKEEVAKGKRLPLEEVDDNACSDH